MGLDWQPLDKPKPGHEAEFDKLYKEIFDFDNKDESLWEQLRAVAISPYETLGAPRVGVDAEADRWAAEEYSKRPRKRLFVSRRKWRKIFHGYYVLDLSRRTTERRSIPTAARAATARPTPFGRSFSTSARICLARNCRGRPGSPTGRPN